MASQCCAWFSPLGAFRAGQTLPLDGLWKGCALAQSLFGPLWFASRLGAIHRLLRLPFPSRILSGLFHPLEKAGTQLFEVLIRLIHRGASEAWVRIWRVCTGEKDPQEPRPPDSHSAFQECYFLLRGFRACTPEQTERSFHIVLVLVKVSDWPCRDVLDLCKVIDSPGSPGVKVCWSV